MERYDPKAIERKWQKVWADERTWEVANETDDGVDRSYVLEMLPYPSGEPHMGHLKCYSIGDAIAHFRRRRDEAPRPSPPRAGSPRSGPTPLDDVEIPSWVEGE